MQPSPAKSAIGGLIGALMALIGILIGNSVARVTSSGHAETPGAAVHEEQH